jgi:hypothetical protein
MLNIRIYFDRTIIFIAMYTGIEKSLHLKYCVIYKNVLDDLPSLLQKYQRLHLCYTYFNVLHDYAFWNNPSTIRKIKDFEYYEDSK